MAAVYVGTLAVLTACSRERKAAPAAVVSAAALPSQAPAQQSASCRECHSGIHDAWKSTDHALANMPVAEADLTAAFQPARVEEDGGSRFHVSRDADGQPRMTSDERGGGSTTYPVEAVLGWKPSRQMLVPQPGGRWQAVDLAWDATRRDWFNVFADEHRHAGEWGHWTGRGMNWNSMCAHCHMTGFRKNYRAVDDQYRSSWVEHGVGCIQCHGPTSPEHGKPGDGGKHETDPTQTWIRDRKRASDTCASCHARHEPLTAEFPPGANYQDHFRLELPVDARLFWPDGQQRDEVFTWTSMALSRMQHAGVTCMDCHDAHSTKTILPAANNQLCQQCHAAPGRVMPGTLVRAPVIEPTAHSHHAAESTGNQCVTCHMPTTNYMVRSPRHDHGWLKPDPLLTKELGIPNACTRCHADRPVEWAIEHADAWYGEKLDSRQRARARAIAAAQAGNTSGPTALLELLATEDVAAWRATYLQLLARGEADATVLAAAREALADADPLVRASAVQVLNGTPDYAAVVRPRLEDPSRLVRFEAAWALGPELANHPEREREFLDYLDLSIDQPGGRMRRGQFFANVGELGAAEAEMRQAAAWDARSAAVHESQAMVLQALGRVGEAATALYRAALIERENGSLMLRAGLGFAEAGKWADAETALRAAVQRQPALDRAWYNLGLLLSQTDRHVEALQALAEAERLAPRVPEYPYAAATLHWQAGDRARAFAAARRALAADPQFAPAAELLRER